MKTTFSIFLAAAIGLAFLTYTPKAEAGDEGWAAFGGFLGGVIVSSIGHDLNRHGRRGSSVEVGYGSGHHSSYGHYEYRTIKRWVPGYWEYQERGHGRSVKVWVEGYYTYDKERVWVKDYYRPSYSFGYSYGHGYGHRYGYGYKYRGHNSHRYGGGGHSRHRDGHKGGHSGGNRDGHKGGNKGGHRGGH